MYDCTVFSDIQAAKLLVAAADARKILGCDACTEDNQYFWLHHVYRLQSNMTTVSLRHLGSLERSIFLPSYGVALLPPVPLDLGRHIL